MHAGTSAQEQPRQHRGCWGALAAIALALGSLAFTASAQGQAFPSRPLVVIYPYPAGSTTDLVSRVFAEMFDEALDATNEQLNALADELYEHVTSATAR